MATPVKDIVTRYVARGSKAKTMKIDAYLTKHLVTGKIIVEVATYKQNESREIDEEGIKFTSIGIGAISRNKGNNFFKFSTNHMLTQSEMDSKEKKELKAMVVTMAVYIDSLINLGAAPIIQMPQPFDPNFA